eukprot:scaffold11144_cov111-Isochrysis_galbana.AAC.6
MSNSVAFSSPADLRRMAEGLSSPRPRSASAIAGSIGALSTFIAAAAARGRTPACTPSLDGSSSSIW